MTESSVRERTIAYITENFLYMRPDLTLADDDGLLEKAIIDSMGVQELVQFLQDQIGIEIADDEITEDNLGSVRSIVRFAMSKQPARVQAA